MKQKTLIIEEYECSKQEKVQRLITDMVKEPDVNLTVRLVYDQVPLTKQALNSIADTIKAVGKQQEFLVDVVLVTRQWNNVKRLRKCLNQYAISVELQVSEQIKISEVKKYTEKLLLEKLLVSCENYQQFCEMYDYWKLTELSIQLDGYELSAKEYQEFFQRWIHDSKAVWFLPFEDMINSMLTGVHVDTCENNSCMGKYVYLDQDEIVYFCSKKFEETKMYSLKQENPKYIYNEVYDKALQAAVEKRKQCQGECQMFGLCRGACPLKAREQESCMEYMQKVSCIGTFLEHEMKDAFVTVENPCMRQLYLSLIAYGFDFVVED